MEEELEDFPMLLMIIYTLQLTRASQLAITTRLSHFMILCVKMQSEFHFDLHFLLFPSQLMRSHQAEKDRKEELLCSCFIVVLCSSFLLWLGRWKTRHYWPSSLTEGLPCTCKVIPTHSRGKILLQKIFFVHLEMKLSSKLRFIDVIQFCIEQH